MKKILFLIVITFGISCIQSVGQTISPENLKNIKVNELTDAQIKSFVKIAEEKGMTQEQLEAMALSRGMPVSEIQKLKARLEKLQNQQRSTMSKDEVKGREYDFAPKDEDLFISLFGSEEMDTILDSQLRKIFGYSLFNNKNLTFEPSLNIPTPTNYIIGPGDQIVIDVWGASQQNYNLMVSPEGSIYITDVGPVYVNGLTMENASVKIKQRLTSIYSGLSGRSPNTYAQISLGNVRSIKVNVTGDALMPGTYTLPSLASAFNALYYAGGPGINGSFRNISVIRENETVAVLDLYDFMIKGNSESNIILQDQDVIFIPTYRIRVELEGEVKRPGLYELKEEETFENLINMGGNFTEKAYTSSIKIIRSNEKEKQISEIKKEDWERATMKNGDKIIIEPILERFANRVEIRGAVYREGVYELSDGLTLKELILKAEGLKDDAFMDRAVLYRLKPNNRTEVISINLNDLFTDNPEDIPLQREDMITIFSIFNLEEQYTVDIDGEVQSPGKYPHYENIKIGDLIATAGGFKESASMAKIDIARRIKDKNSVTSGNKIARLFTFSIDEKLRLNDSAMQFVLEPYDIIFVRKSPGYEKQKYVYIKGEVSFPGTYSLTTKNDHISDLIEKAGGFTNEAYLNGARLTRKIMAGSKERLKAIEAIKSEAGDSVDINVSLESEQFIGIDLLKIMSSPKSKYDLLLQEGDMLEIPKQLQTVSMSGALLYPISARYDNSYSFRQYINRAGGFAQNALKRKTYVIYANGSVKRTHSFFGFRNFPKIEPGAEIIVPEKPDKEKISVQEMVSLGSIVTSMAMVVVTTVRSLQ